MNKLAAQSKKKTLTVTGAGGEEGGWKRTDLNFRGQTWRLEVSNCQTKRVFTRKGENSGFGKKN